MLYQLQKMKCLLAFLALLVSGVVSRVHVRTSVASLGSYLYDDLAQNPTVNDSLAPKSEDGVQKVMAILKGNLTVAVDQAMATLDSLLLLKGRRQVSEGLRDKISSFKESLLVSFETDLQTLVTELKRSADGPQSDVDPYEFSELVKTKWESTLAAKLEVFSNDALPGWVRSVVHVWKGVENVVMDKIRKLKQSVSRTYPRSQTSCTLPQPVLLGSNQVASALNPLNERGIVSRSVALDVLRFVGAIIGGIVLVVASVIFITLFFVASLIATIIAGILGIFGLQNDHYYDT